MKEIVVYTHSDCLLKDNGSNHPERKERLEIIIKSIKEISSVDTVIKEAPLANIEVINLVHPREYIDNIFDTYLRLGDGGNQTVTNNLNFGNGGFVWVKERNANNSHTLFSTDIADVGGKRPYLTPNTWPAQPSIVS